MTGTPDVAPDGEAIRTAVRRDGFATVEALTTAEEIAWLVEAYDRLFEPDSAVRAEDRFELAGEQDGAGLLPQVVNPERYLPELLDTIAHRQAFELARAVLGEEARPAGMHAIRKPPRDGAETPWHQDEAYWDPRFEHDAISIWMPLQRVTVGNGCMQFVPGSHRDGVLEHRLVSPTAHGLVLADLSVIRHIEACPLPAGGATVHTSTTVHYTGPNATDSPRRALIMAFDRPGTPLPEPRSYPWQRPEWHTEEH